MELITIELERNEYNRFFLLNIPHKVKDVKVKDDFFKEDKMYSELKKRADNAYKELEDYKFKKRHNIK